MFGLCTGLQKESLYLDKFDLSFLWFIQFDNLVIFSTHEWIIGGCNKANENVDW